MITALTGSNSFLLKVELDRLTADFFREHGDFALEKLDGEEASYERIAEAVQSLPFLAVRKMVILRDGSANKEFVENFDQLLPTVSESTDFIIVEPKVDKRLAYYKMLKSKTEFREFQELDAHGLANWLVKTAKEQDGTISSSDARYLVERVGQDQQLLSNELEKLLNYQPNVTKETIDLLTEQSPQSTIFELLDAAFAGNMKRAFELYHEQRVLQVEPQQILAMMTWQLHVLAVIKTAAERSPDEIASSAKLNPYVVRKSQSIARQLTLGELKKLVHELLEIDARMKSEAIDDDEALQNYLLALSL